MVNEFGLFESDMVDFLGGLALFPYTAAMFSVSRKGIIENREIQFLKYFGILTGKSFGKFNCLKLFFLIIGLLLYFNYEFLFFYTSAASMLGKILLLSIIIVYVLTIIYFFPVNAHFQLKTFMY